MSLKDVTDAHRTDPSKARCWSVSASGQWTIVVATCKEEARRLGLVWIAEHLGKTTINLNTQARVTAADDRKVERWRAARAQQEQSAELIRQVKAARP